MVTFALHLRVKPGREAEAVAALTTIERRSRGDAGCQYFTWFQHDEEPLRFTLLEQWESQRHLDDHLAQDQSVWEAFVPALAENPVSQRLRPVADLPGRSSGPGPVPRWAHVGLNCRDQDVTEAFYTRWFGFRRVRLVELEDLRVVFLRRADAVLELFATDAEPLGESEADGPTRPGTVRHLAFQVDDLDAFLKAADGRLDVTLGPLSFDAVVPGWRAIWVRDPDGLVVEIAEGYTDDPRSPQAELT
ncbi:antibiotic biosynthesis monooxygenase [Streptomyces beihaiensis]|uniref:Antibiotic biosynthesis monooxygenase n=1 Tax=Streptomyces beihaiensis TaxID=2984495 RepID=A0ABT3TUQ5_9ACTN|nr:antibiotic biosynthesis monooxygenase [Streptomyces beihaiensis]MCX3060162.1 antibiotic biosynthesis monooxygenase [Streptomyces beihaiensis]